MVAAAFLPSRVLPLMAALLVLPASAGIFRCTSPDGAVTYQQSACPASDAPRVIDAPASYPDVDPAERRRLFEREAELDRRLEAWRERESRETIARATQPAPQSTALPEPQATWVLAPVARGNRLARGRHAFQRGS